MMPIHDLESWRDIHFLKDHCLKYSDIYFVLEDILHTIYDSVLAGDTDEEIMMESVVTVLNKFSLLPVRHEDIDHLRLFIMTTKRDIDRLNLPIQKVLMFEELSPHGDYYTISVQDLI